MMEKQNKLFEDAIEFYKKKDFNNAQARYEEII